MVGVGVAADDDEVFSSAGSHLREGETYTETTVVSVCPKRSVTPVHSVGSLERRLKSSSQCTQPLHT